MAAFESKVAAVYNYLSIKAFPVQFTASQRQNLKRFATNFKLKDGLLYRTVEGKNRKVVTSLAEAIAAFGEAHASESGGHCGMIKTRDTLASRVYWPGMSKDIKHWVAACEDCQKAEETLPVEPVQHSRRVSKVWEVVVIDILGPLSPTSKGYEYILTATDFYSKWVYAYPMKTKSSAEVADNLLSVIFAQGFPQRFLSDQGSEFVHQLNIDICKGLRIDDTFAVAHYPQTNQLDEKTHHNIKSALLKVVQEKPANWHRFLNPVLFSLRNEKHWMTKLTPFQVMYGREAIPPCDMPADIVCSTDKRSSTGVQYSQAQ